MLIILSTWNCSAAGGWWTPAEGSAMWCRWRRGTQGDPCRFQSASAAPGSLPATGLNGDPPGSPRRARHRHPLCRKRGTRPRDSWTGALLCIRPRRSWLEKLIIKLIEKKKSFHQFQYGRDFFFFFYLRVVMDGPEAGIPPSLPTQYSASFRAR